jgi:cyclophilin family peptidyl-prolyl cis-trans isomerase
MAQHKAATDVTIAPLGERTLLEQIVHRSWMPVLAVTLAVTAWALYREHARKKDLHARDSAWTELFASSGAPEEYTALASRLGETPAAPWARLQAVRALVDEERFDEASVVLEELRQSAPDHPLSKDLLDFGDGRPPRSLLDDLSEAIEGQKGWVAEHPELFQNPPPPEDAPRVRLQTDQGDIVVALYQSEAPNHAANFLNLCGAKFYDGTRFHRVIPGLLVQGGDPNSRNEDRTAWGQGGPEAKIEPEPNDLHHFAGVLSAAKLPGEQQSSGSQFFLTTEKAHHFDGEHVVFGAVVEGLDVVRKISEGAIREGTGDQPENPATLTATEVL